MPLKMSSAKCEAYCLSLIVVFKVTRIFSHWNGKVGQRLTLKRLGHFFQYVILFPSVIQQKYNIFIYNWSNKLNV